MGINLTWVCQKHNMVHTSLRGEEHIDFQALVRIHPECFRNGNMIAYHDGWIDNSQFTEFWPTWEDRPAEKRKQ